MQYTGVGILCLFTSVFHYHITIMGVSRLFLGGASSHLSHLSPPIKQVRFGWLFNAFFFGVDFLS